MSIPVIACGGAGKWQDFVDGIRIAGADAVATTNIYHFTETSIRSAKQYLLSRASTFAPRRPTRHAMPQQSRYNDYPCDLCGADDP